VKLSWTSLIDRWSEAVWLDYAVAVAVVSTHMITVIILSPGTWFSWPSDMQRLAVYSSGATVVSIIVGITAVALPVYLAAGGERAKTVRCQYPDSMRKNWRTLLSGMGLAAGLCLIAQIVDRGGHPEPSWFTFELGSTIAVTKFIRLVWLFDAIIKASH
jgi:hypothetical protein